MHLYGIAAQRQAFENIMNGSDVVAKAWLTEHLQKHHPDSELLKTAARGIIKDVPQADHRSISDKINEQRSFLAERNQL